MRFLNSPQAAAFYGVTENTLRKYQTYSSKAWKIRTRYQDGVEMYAVPDNMSEIERCFDGVLKGAVKTRLERHFAALKTSPLVQPANVPDENPFDATRARDLTYCLRWAKEESRLKNKPLNAHTHPAKGKIYAIADLIAIFDKCTVRESGESWKWLRLGIPGTFVKGGTAQYFYVTASYPPSRETEFCTLLDFLDRILPMMKGDVAQIINAPKNMQFYVGEEPVIPVVDSVNDPEPELTDAHAPAVDVVNDSEPELTDEPTVTDQIVEISDESALATGTEVVPQNPFITNNATNMAYCLEWALAETKRKKKTLNVRTHPEKGKVYGIVDMIGTFGDSLNRNSDKSFWQRLRERAPVHFAPVSESREFYVTMDYFAKPMDFCTLTDFLDHVIPHMRGNVAQIINAARGQVATLVGTGSESVLGITAINREAAENAPEHIRNTIDDVRTTTERRVVETATVPINVQSTLSFANGSVSICRPNPPGELQDSLSNRKRKHEEMLTQCRTIEQGFYAIQISDTLVKAGITQTNLQQRVEQVQSDFPASFLLFIIKSGNPTRLETKLFDHPLIKHRRKTVNGRSGKKYTEVFEFDEHLDAERFETIAQEMESERQRESGDTLVLKQMELEFTKSIECEKIRADVEKERLRVEADVDKEKIRADLELKKMALEMCKGDSRYIELFKMLK